MRFLLLLITFTLSLNFVKAQDDYFRDPNSPNISDYKTGITLLNQGKKKKALKSFRKASDENPDFYQAHMAAGYLLRELGECDNAILYFNRAIKSNPKSSIAYFNRGNCFLELKKFNLAASDYNLSIKHDSLFWAAYNNLAVVHIQNQGGGKIQSSELNIAKAKFKELEKKQEIQDTSMLMNIGLIHLYLFEFKEALPYFQRINAMNPAIGRAHYGEALCRYYTRQYQEAKKHFEISKSLNYNVENCNEFLDFLDFILEQLKKYSTEQKKE
jgi:tetratricopeptide (TPR) repeat protein